MSYPISGLVKSFTTPGYDPKKPLVVSRQVDCIKLIYNITRNEAASFYTVGVFEIKQLILPHEENVNIVVFLFVSAV